MKPKIIIFDLDGVLFDSNRFILSFLLDTYPTLTKETMDELLRGNFHDGMERFKLTNKAIQETAEQKKARDVAYAARKGASDLFPGIRELLEGLHAAGETLAINTSALARNCLPMIEHAGIADLFALVATKELAVHKSEKFRLIGEKFGIQFADMLFITDTLGDLREAEAVGVPTIAVTWGAHDRSYFEDEPHKNLIAVVDSVAELKDRLLD